MESTDCDVLVIGGGPGGSTAAAFARQKGLSVCFAEQEEFPRFHIGESLLPMGNAVLRASGAWPKVEAAGFVRKLGAEFMLADGSEPKDIVFAEGYVPGLESTFQVERARFDTILLDHARSLGADVRMGTTVRALVPSADFVTATLTRSGAEGPARLTARWVVDAGGRDNLYDEPGEAEAGCPPIFPEAGGRLQPFRGRARAPPGTKGGNIIIVRIEDGWFWIIPISAERTSVGLVTSIERPAPGADPEAVFHATVAGSPRLRSLMERSSPVAPFRVTADYSYVRQDFASPRVILAGDAAAFYDPIFSSGVYVAPHSAQVALRRSGGPTPPGGRSAASSAAVTPAASRSTARVSHADRGLLRQRQLRRLHDPEATARPRPRAHLDRGGPRPPDLAAVVEVQGISWRSAGCRSVLPAGQAHRSRIAGDAQPSVRPWIACPRLCSRAARSRSPPRITRRCGALIFFAPDPWICAQFVLPAASRPSARPRPHSPRAAARSG